MISVPTGLHAIHVSARLPLAFTIFIYLEVFMSALHVIQVLIDRILYVYSNDKDLMLQLEGLPSKPKHIVKDKKNQREQRREDPYGRVQTGLHYQNSRSSRRKIKGMKEVNKKFRKKQPKKNTNEDYFWQVLKGRTNDSIKANVPKGRKPTNMREEFNKGVLSKLNKKPAGTKLTKYKSTY